MKLSWRAEVLLDETERGGAARPLGLFRVTSLPHVQADMLAITGKTQRNDENDKQAPASLDTITLSSDSPRHTSTSVSILRHCFRSMACSLQASCHETFVRENSFISLIYLLIFGESYHIAESVRNRTNKTCKISACTRAAVPQIFSRDTRNVQRAMTTETLVSYPKLLLNSPRTSTDNPSRCPLTPLLSVFTSRSWVDEGRGGPALRSAGVRVAPYGEGLRGNPERPDRARVHPERDRGRP